MGENLSVANGWKQRGTPGAPHPCGERLRVPGLGHLTVDPWELIKAPQPSQAAAVCLGNY